MPLADTLRPKSLDDVIGQQHLVGPNMPIRKMVDKDSIKSILLHGPAGIGKTTIARCLAHDSACAFEELNATSSKIADIRKLIDKAAARKKSGTVTVAFVDEIHRWAKNIQDALLPSVEDGTIVLVGSTTEKPNFAVNSALLSRMQSYELYPLTKKDMATGLIRVVKHYKSNGVDFKIGGAAATRLINRCSGDIRKLMTSLETIVEVLLEDDKEITDELVDVAIPDKYYFFDKSGNGHFDMAQNYQCAIQDSDADSAIYWLAKWLLSGEDPVYIARRILISASEDACSNPNASMIANNAYVAAKEMGYPECRIPMAHATIEIAKSDRDRTANDAIAAAIEDVENGKEVLAVHANGKDHNTGAGYAKINKSYT